MLKRAKDGALHFQVLFLPVDRVPFSHFQQESSPIHGL